MLKYFDKDGTEIPRELFEAKRHTIGYDVIRVTYPKDGWRVRTLWDGIKMPHERLPKLFVVMRDRSVKPGNRKEATWKNEYAAWHETRRQADEDHKAQDKAIAKGLVECS